MKKSIQRTTKPKDNKGIVTSGVGNQTQSVNVTVNLPKEVTKKRRVNKPRTDGKKKKAIQDLKDAMQAYQSAKDSAISEGKTIPDDLLISTQAMGSVDTISEIQALGTELQERTSAINQIPITPKVDDNESEPQDITMFSGAGSFGENVFGTTTVKASPFGGGDAQDRPSEGDTLSQLNNLEQSAKNRLEESVSRGDPSEPPTTPQSTNDSNWEEPVEPVDLVPEEPIVPSGNATGVGVVQTPEEIAAAQEIVATFIKSDGRSKAGRWNETIRNALRVLGVKDDDIDRIDRLTGKTKRKKMREMINKLLPGIKDGGSPSSPMPPQSPPYSSSLEYNNFKEALETSREISANAGKAANQLAQDKFNLVTKTNSEKQVEKVMKSVEESIQSLETSLF